MKNVLKYFLIFILTLVIFSCKTNKSPAEGKEEVKMNSVGIKDSVEPVVVDPIKQKIDTSLCRLVIEFYSIGEGIDMNECNTLEEDIGTFSQRIGKNIDYRKTHWGREGETDFCIKLNELSSSEQLDFVEEMSGKLKKAKWVHIYENYPCPDRGRRR